MDKEALLRQLGTIEEYFDRSTACLTEEDGAFAPVEGLMTAAQQVAHVAQTVDWFVAGASRPEGFDMDFEKHMRGVMAVGSLSRAREWSKRSFAAAREMLQGLSAAELEEPLPPGVMGGQPRHAIFGALADHTAHHRGALTVYARLRGRVPAMPYGADAGA